MTLDIVERLLNWVDYLPKEWRREAAAEIERLRDENELLRDEKGCCILDQKDEIERLRAELERLRKENPNV